MSEIEKGCTFNHRDGFPEQELFEVRAERDRLSDHLLKMQVTNGSLTDQIDRLKAELELEHEGMLKAISNRDKLHAEWLAIERDRDLWKSRYEAVIIQLNEKQKS